MKKFFIGLTCFALLLSLSLSVAAFAPTPRQVVRAAEANQTLNRVVVNGVGEVKVVPDVASITVAINSNNNSITAAENDNAAKVDKVINVLINAGISENNVKTTSYTIYERTEKADETETTVYNVSSVLEFKTSANNDLNGLISSLTEAGVSQVYGVRFEVGDHTKFYSAALEVAINNANNKAKTIFGETGFKIVEVIEAPNSNYEAMPLNFARTKGFQKGEQTVSAYVKVVYEAV